MKMNLLAIAVLAMLTGCGGSGGSDEKKNNTAAMFSGDTAGTLAADDPDVSGSLTITDPDNGESAAVVQTNVSTSYGTFSINANGQWSYSADPSNSALIALGSNASLVDTISVKSVDGASQSITITVNGVNDTPMFGTGSGEDSASISNNLGAPFTGTLSITDPDTGEDTFVAQAVAMKTYGDFSIAEDGAWSYTLDTSNTTILALADETDSVAEELVVSSVDGTNKTISITISGVSTTTAGGLTKGSIGSNDSVPAVNCTTTVSSISALENAVSYAMTAGDTICLASDTYSNLDLTFGGTGTAESPITVAAAVPGEVFINGEVFIGITGEYVVLQGFIFKDGSMDSSLLQTRANSNTACNNCRITDNAFINMDEGMDDSTKWFQIYGSGNRFDHNWVSGKATRGALFIIERGDAPGTIDRTQIDHNYFGDRPPKDGLAYADNSDNEYEGIRIGSSDTHTSDSFAIVEHNYFEQIDGEAEVISIKAGGVTVAHNTIRNSRGSIVNRHGEGSVIDNNYIIGDGNPFAGGVRVVDANHSVTNNYIQGARNSSSNFYGGILISSSDGSTTNGYQDVENVLVANNTIVDSVNSINLFAGNKNDRPDSIYFVNNLVADAIGPVMKNADTLPANSVYAGNYVFGQTLADDELITISGMSLVDPALMADSNGLYRPTATSPDLSADTNASIGSYTLPSKDMDGQTRTSNTIAGADEISSQTLAATDMRGLLTPELVGPLSYTPPSTSPYINRVEISNADFDTQNADGWSNVDATVTTAQDEVFSRGSSVQLDSTGDSLSQTIAVTANTNYTLSAYVKGTGKLSAMVDGMTYSVDENSSDYTFTSISFNSGAGTSLEISATLDDLVLGSVAINNPNFDNDQDDWVVNEGTGIGQVQDSSNSASGADGSIKFKHNDVDDGTPYQPYISQTLTVQPNTEYTLTMYSLLKDNDAQDATVLFGAHTGAAIVGGVFDSGDVIASKDSVYGDLSADDEGDDSFRPDVLVFNSGDNTSLTIFAQYQSTMGDDIRIDNFSLTAEGAPATDAEAYFDSFRLVSHPSL
jgi:poly(beta-D-mannuronate) lyase